MTTSLVRNGYKDDAFIRTALLGRKIGKRVILIAEKLSEVRSIVRLAKEAARIYAKLRRLGHPIEYLDVGGGLAIDYDGSRTPTDASTNYGVEEYARDVVWNIADVCDEERVPHPNIVSESGRAIVAQHCVLVVEAFGVIGTAATTPAATGTTTPPPAADEHKLVRALRDIEQSLTAENLLESWHDLLQTKEEAEKVFELGLLELPTKAAIEIGFSRVANRIRSTVAKMDPAEVEGELAALEGKFDGQHICNFSVFPSLLDHWAFGALLPIVPLHRLDERPDVLSTLADITCDSDGKVAKFIDKDEPYRETLPLHALNAPTLLPRRVPHGRVPGHHGRHPQPLRPGQRGPRLPR